MENEELIEEEEAVENTASESNDFKSLVIKEMTRIINKYREIKFERNDDPALIEGMNKKTEIINVVNHIMNNLTKRRIMCGSDETTYEYIHEYYVDKFDVVEDSWSKYIRNEAPTTPSPKQVAKDEAKSKITEEQKQKFYEEALEEAKRAAKFKAEEDLRKAEAKRKEKEKKKKEALELKRKEEMENDNLSGGLFDFL